MEEKRKEGDEGVSAFIGISAPETPKYLLTNNFIAEFYSPSEDINTSYDYDFFENQDILICEEDNKETKEKLKASFNYFFNKFTSYESAMNRHKEAKKKHYFPLSLKMLRTSSLSLRHLLINLLNLDEDEFVEIQNKLEVYLYQNLTGVNYVVSKLCSNIDHDKPVKRKSVSSTRESFSSFKDKSYFKKLGNSFKGDLNVLLSHSYFFDMDFYKRYEYLSILLTSYVIQFIVYRKGDTPFILCKGSSTESKLNSGEFHRACVNNYADIRSVFPELLKQYYLSRLKGISRITVQLEDNNIYVNDILFTEFIKDKFFWNKIQNIDEFNEKAKKVFGLKKGVKFKEYEYIDQFVLCYIDLTKTRSGSSLTKISSTLPTSGREIGFVFPSNNAKHKYFAISQSLAEYYVRFYLAKIDKEYAYLDEFIEFLETKYNIYMFRSDNIKKKIKSYHTKVSEQELRNNEEAFYETLRAVNCLIKLSDSGYVITLPEKRGDFKLL